MKVYDFLRSVVAQLGDDRPNKPFMRYALKDLVTYYNEAMCFVASNRPDLFTEITVMKLEPGFYQDARCCGCGNVIELVAQVDKDGNVVRQLDGADMGAAGGQQNRWYRPLCRATNTPGAGPVAAPKYIITGFEVQPDMNGVFLVQPPVPPGVDAWVALKCVRNPASLSEDAVRSGSSTPPDCKFMPGIRSYVLYRALQGDRLAVGAATEAQQELKNAYSYFNVQMKNEITQENV